MGVEAGSAKLTECFTRQSGGFTETTGLIRHLLYKQHTAEAGPTMPQTAESGLLGAYGCACIVRHLTCIL